jgi:hypothetical protein
MSNETSATGADDSSRIDVNEESNLRDWAEKFDATSEQIRNAVKAVGDQAADVEMHLKGTHATTNADQEARADAGAPGKA